MTTRMASTIAILLLTAFIAAISSDSVRAAQLKPVPAIFTFGDSLAAVRTNDGAVLSPPYGIDYIPSGRYCNGKLIGDFLGEQLYEA